MYNAMAQTSRHVPHLDARAFFSFFLVAERDKTVSRCGVMSTGRYKTVTGRRVGTRRFFGRSNFLSMNNNGLFEEKHLVTAVGAQLKDTCVRISC